MLEEITLGGVTYKVAEHPELKAFVDTMRKDISTQEKKKVYSTIEELQKDIKNLESVKVEGGNGAEGLASLKEEILGDLKNYLKPVVEQTEFNKKADIESYRNKLIQDNQGQCMPELVVGTTKEELDEALTKSKELYSNYANKNGTPNTSGTPNPTPAPATTPAATTPAPTAPSTTVPRIEAAQKSEENIKAMSQEEFAQKREELQKKLKDIVPAV